MKLEVSQKQLSRALRIAAQRGLMPTGLSSEGLREIEAEVRRRVFFSARTSSATYLGELQKLTQRYLEGGYKNDLPRLRIEARRLLARCRYDPEQGGFPGDAALGVPPAAKGSLRDLSSEARLNLIFKTQMQLATGEAQYLSGNSKVRLYTHPAWELAVSTAATPRIDWESRWHQCGGPTVKDGRLVAPKWHPVWSKLGDSGRFADALDTTHPPYAFNSERIWLELTRREAKAAGLVRLKAPVGWQISKPKVDVTELKTALEEALGVGRLRRGAAAQVKATVAKLKAQEPEVMPERKPVMRTAEEKAERKRVLGKARAMAEEWLKTLKS